MAGVSLNWRAYGYTTRVLVEGARQALGCHMKLMFLSS
jgi:hypothetical protein